MSSPKPKGTPSPVPLPFPVVTPKPNTSATPPGVPIPYPNIGMEKKEKKGIVINILDVWDPDMTRVEGQVTNGTTIRMGGMSNGVGQMVAEVVRLAKTRQASVSRLRIFGHGKEGVMGVSVGTGSSPAYSPKLRSSLDFQNLNAIKADLEKLKPHFEDGAIVELFGCSTGGGANGNALLSGLANLWGVEVKAGALVQYYGTPDQTNAFEGPVMSAKPGQPVVSDRNPMEARQVLYHLKSGEFEKILRHIGPR